MLIFDKIIEVLSENFSVGVNEDFTQLEDSKTVFFFKKSKCFSSFLCEKYFIAFYNYVFKLCL